jgi:hypothetical protein
VYKGREDSDHSDFSTLPSEGKSAKALKGQQEIHTWWMDSCRNSSGPGAGMEAELHGMVKILSLPVIEN